MTAKVDDISATRKAVIILLWIKAGGSNMVIVGKERECVSEKQREQSVERR